MGLDFTFRGCQLPFEERVHWSYTGFRCFRERLAKEIGIDLHEMQGFGGEKSWKNIKDAIVPLLNHSDCQGYLSPSACRCIAPRLRELVEGWPQNVFSFSEEGYDRKEGLRLANMMSICAKKKVRLVFC